MIRNLAKIIMIQNQKLSQKGMKILIHFSDKDLRKVKKVCVCSPITHSLLDEFKENIQEFENLEQYSKTDFSGVPEDKLNMIALHQFDKRYKEEVEISIGKPVANEGILEGILICIVA
jgi:hypothetical protein